MTTRHRRSRILVTVPVALTTAAVLAACGGTDAVTSALPLSEKAQQGQTIAQRSGCASCHNATGKPSVGPTWKGIWGTTVTLSDGRTATVDDAYIRRSVQEPAADVLPGFATAMPKISLSDDEIAAVTAYIRELTPTVPPTR